MDDDGNQLGFELSLHVIMFHEAIARRLGVSNSEHKMLDLIARHSPGVTPSELAAATGLSSPAITKIIDRLVAVGFVERTRNPADGRSFRLSTTQRYRSAARETSIGIAERIGELNGSFTAEEISAIGRWVAGVVAALHAETSTLERTEPDGSGH